jgi:hypothetical protein
MCKIFNGAFVNRMWGRLGDGEVIAHFAWIGDAQDFAKACAASGKAIIRMLVGGLRHTDGQDRHLSARREGRRRATGGDVARLILEAFCLAAVVAVVLRAPL